MVALRWPGPDPPVRAGPGDGAVLGSHPGPAGEGLEPVVPAAEQAAVVGIRAPALVVGLRVVGVAVDEVMDVQGISEEHVEAHGGARDALIRGLGHVESDVVVLVDIHTLVTQVLL